MILWIDWGVLKCPAFTKPLGTGRSWSKMAYVTHHRQFEFVVMPFGLWNAPATFQHLMQMVLSGLEHFCSAYIKDIIVFSSLLRNTYSTWSRSSTTFRRLTWSSSRISASSSRRKFLIGYMVSSEGLKIDPQKVDALQKFRTQQSPNCYFLRLESHYRHFVLSWLLPHIQSDEDRYSI